MILKSVHVTNYRSIEDSTVVDIESGATSFVGKNESGKTAFMKAIYKLKPAESNEKYDEVLDFPSRLTKKRKETTGPIQVLCAKFELTDEDVNVVENDLGVGALSSPIVTVTASYRNNKWSYSSNYDEGKIVSNLRAGLELTPTNTAAVDKATNVRELIATLESLQEPSATTTALLARLNTWREQSVGLYLIDKYFCPWLPTFVYFDEYSDMPGRASIPDLINKRDSGTLNRGERALLALLEMISAKPEDFTDQSNYEYLVRELENAANSISQEVFKYWSQNKNLKVKLSIAQPESNAVPPLNQGPVLHLRVENTDHGVTVPFDERSRGFVWFFSFLAYFSELEGAKDKKLILLLDEPGLSLHATAQADLLRFIDERLVPKHQVLYTTHSPFMIAPDKFDRVRTVQDILGEGTIISDDILKVDAEIAFPLQAALGYDLAQTLFVGKNNLLLEGPSDLIPTCVHWYKSHMGSLASYLIGELFLRAQVGIIYLDVFSEALTASGKAGLDERWVKVPVGGAGKLSTFVSLLGANKLKVAVVVDSSTKGAETLKHLNATGKLKGGKLVQVSEVTGTKEADIEDIFDPAFYLELVNEAYKNDLAKPIKLSDLTSKRPRITQRVDDYFIANGIAGGKLNHYRPSVVLLREQTKLVQKLGQPTLNRAETLINRLNALL